MVEDTRITVLKVGTSATSDQQRIARKQPLRVALIQQVAMVRIGVTRRKDRAQGQATDLKRTVFGDADIGTRQALHRGQCDLAAGALTQTAGRADVVGVNVRVKGISESQAKLLERGQVAFHGFNHRVDQHSITGVCAGEQVRVRGRLGFEQLPKDHVDQIQPTDSRSLQRALEICSMSAMLQTVNVSIKYNL